MYNVFFMLSNHDIFHNYLLDIMHQEKNYSSFFKISRSIIDILHIDRIDLSREQVYSA